MWGDLIYGHVEIPAGMDDLHLQIIDEQGEMVEDMALGYQSNGEARFVWNGVQTEFNDMLLDVDWEKFATDENVQPIPHAHGNYQFKVVGISQGEQQELAVSMSSRVDSVSIKANNELQLNLAGNQTSSLDQVKQIN